MAFSWIYREKYEECPSVELVCRPEIRTGHLQNMAQKHDRLNKLARLHVSRSDTLWKQGKVKLKQIPTDLYTIIHKYVIGSKDSWIFHVSSFFVFYCFTNLCDVIWKKGACYLLSKTRVIIKICADSSDCPLIVSEFFGYLFLYNL
jgi:hypothetical protein